MGTIAALAPIAAGISEKTGFGLAICIGAVSYTHLIHHIESQHHRFAQFDKLQGEVEVSLQAGGAVSYTHLALYQKYEARAQEEEKVIFGGRLGKYKYYDMHHVVAEALDCVEKELR